MPVKKKDTPPKKKKRKSKVPVKVNGKEIYHTSKFDPKRKYLKLAQEYIDSCEDSVVDGMFKVNIPTIEGFSKYINVSRRTLFGWQSEYDVILHSLELINREQKHRLIIGGLSGHYNSTIAKLVLSSNHDMFDRKENNNNNNHNHNFSLSRLRSEMEKNEINVIDVTGKQNGN